MATTVITPHYACYNHVISFQESIKAINFYQTFIYKSTRFFYCQFSSKQSVSCFISSTIKTESVSWVAVLEIELEMLIFLLNFLLE